MSSAPPISLKTAREVLGVGPFYTSGDLRRAFREAAKRKGGIYGSGWPEI